MKTLIYTHLIYKQTQTCKKIIRKKKKNSNCESSNRISHTTMILLFELGLVGYAVPGLEQVMSLNPMLVASFQ